MAHNERCGKCKATVQAMLEKIYGPVTPNYRIALGTRPEEYAGEVVYPALSRVYSALQQHRGYEDFVRAQHVAADFFIPYPGFVVEFDESQHFTKPRLIALENYPVAMQVGYSVPRWRELCAALDKHDNDPPYRDEQRAWVRHPPRFPAGNQGVPADGEAVCRRDGVVQPGPGEAGGCGEVSEVFGGEEDVFNTP